MQCAESLKNFFAESNAICMNEPLLEINKEKGGYSLLKQPKNVTRGPVIDSARNVPPAEYKKQTPLEPQQKNK